MTCRRHTDGNEPKPEPGEYVVFAAHFARGFGLPASPFFRGFLNSFHLQPHHLPANTITTLLAYVAFSEGYLGLWPTVDLWAKYFQLQKQSIPDPDSKDMEMTPCGAATILPRRGSIFPRILVLDSCRKWQRTFFYVKNTNAKVDKINLPPFKLGAPTEQFNWHLNPRDKNPEVNEIDEYVGRLTEEGMTADDLLRTFISRRVCPLQRRVHKICHMSGLRDPTRVSTFDLTKAQIRTRVKAIAKTEMTVGWEWGKEPHDRDHLPENVSDLLPYRHTISSEITFIPVHLFRFLLNPESLCRFLAEIRPPRLRRRSEPRIQVGQRFACPGHSRDRRSRR